MSHSKPVTCALYNSLFNQVVSSCHESVVSVWDLETGTKTIQFSKAHTYTEKGIEKSAEITAMTFDPSLRRLITGGRDGTVKVWNFNNGACLRELEVFDYVEVILEEKLLFWEFNIFYIKRNLIWVFINKL